MTTKLLSKSTYTLDSFLCALNVHIYNILKKEELPNIDDPFLMHLKIQYKGLFELNRDNFINNLFTSQIIYMGKNYRAKKLNYLNIKNDNSPEKASAGLIAKLAFIELTVEISYLSFYIISKYHQNYTEFNENYIVFLTEEHQFWSKNAIILHNNPQLHNQIVKDYYELTNLQGYNSDVNHFSRALVQNRIKKNNNIPIKRLEENVKEVKKVKEVKESAENIVKKVSKKPGGSFTACNIFESQHIKF